jgi:Tfp pilus assembly protein PilV
MSGRFIEQRARRRAARHRASAAYTAVEVLMSLAVLAVGIIGLIAGEKVTLAANQHSKNLAIATHIAESWLGMIDAEAALWSANGSRARTTWLSQFAGTTGWLRPAYDANLAFGPGFDALGNPVTGQNPGGAAFCSDLRMTSLTPTATGGGMIRVEVRVVWLRNDVVVGGTVAGAPLDACGIAAGAVDAVNESRLFHFVYMSGAVRQVGK